MNMTKKPILYAVAVAIAMSLAGCGGGNGGDKGNFINDGYTARCANGTSNTQSTREQAEAFCRNFGGGLASTPNP